MLNTFAQTLQSWHAWERRRTAFEAWLGWLRQRQAQAALLCDTRHDMQLRAVQSLAATWQHAVRPRPVLRRTSGVRRNERKWAGQ